MVQISNGDWPSITAGETGPGNDKCRPKHVSTENPRGPGQCGVPKLNFNNAGWYHPIVNSLQIYIGSSYLSYMLVWTSICHVMALLFPSCKKATTRKVHRWTKYLTDLIDYVTLISHYFLGLSSNKSVFMKC